MDEDATIEAVFTEKEDAHNYTLQTTVLPTCTEAGYTLYECSECGIQKKSDVFPSNGHDFEDTTVEPTCTEVGYTIHACKNCDYSYTDTIPLLNHNDSNGDGMCDRCGKEMTGSEQNLCPYCHKTHTGPMAGFVGFFHKIIYFFKHLFGKM